MELEKVRQKWKDYNQSIIDKFCKINNFSENDKQKLNYFGVDYLIDFESELDEDPDNEDGGILTLDTVTAGYIDSFMGRWYIQNTPDLDEKDFIKLLELLQKLYSYLKTEKLYKEKAAQYQKLNRRLENKKKYLKRFKEFKKIQLEKDDEEKYLDLMREWEYEDLI